MIKYNIFQVSDTWTADRVAFRFTTHCQT